MFGSHRSIVGKTHRFITCFLGETGSYLSRSISLGFFSKTVPGCSGLCLFTNKTEFKSCVLFALLSVVLLCFDLVWFGLGFVFVCFGLGFFFVFFFFRFVSFLLLLLLLLFFSFFFCLFVLFCFVLFFLLCCYDSFCSVFFCSLCSVSFRFGPSICSVCEVFRVLLSSK